MASTIPHLRAIFRNPPALTRFISPAGSSSSRNLSTSMRQSSQLLHPSILAAAATSIRINLPSIPSLLEGVWESILRAVPKKKTTHSKKRHRQMAGKALKDVTALCKCPGCGQTKRMHYLCPNCTTSKTLLSPPSSTSVLICFHSAPRRIDRREAANHHICDQPMNFSFMV